MGLFDRLAVATDLGQVHFEEADGTIFKGMFEDLSRVRCRVDEAVCADHHPVFPTTFPVQSQHVTKRSVVSKGGDVELAGKEV